MKNTFIKYVVVFVLVTVLILYPGSILVSFAEAETGPKSIDIVYIIDTSGSVDSTDKERNADAALKLGVDLAPENSRIAIIAVDDIVVSEAELTDVSSHEGRESLKGYINQLVNKGNTDFSVGLGRAIEILEGSSASDKRIIFLGDFSEGGYNAGSDEEEAANRITAVTARAKSKGIAIDTLFWEPAPEKSITAPLLKDMSEQTGGRFLEVDNPNQLPGAVEDIYFQNYSYLYSLTSVRGESEHVMNVPMLTDHVRRARIYVSSKNPVSAYSASYSGVGLDGEQNRSYAMIDLDHPAREGIHMTLTPGETGVASVYLLVEYDIKLSVSVTNATDLIKGEKEYTQTSTLQAEIVDSQTGKPLLSAPYGETGSFTVTISSPSGSDIREYSTGSLDSYDTYIFKPTEFGTYTINAELKVGDLVLIPGPATVDIPDMRPVIEPTNWPLIIAVSVGAVLILTALIIAYRHRKKESEFHGAVEMASDYRFHGKLYVCAVMVAGGNKEIAPFNFMLGQFHKEKRISLKQILDSGRVMHDFPGSEDILFLVGPEDSIIIRNNAKVMIRSMGKDYGPQTKLQLYFGQKIYVVFEKDENELEIYYREVSGDA